MGDAAAVTDDVQAGVAGLQLLVDLYFHVVEFDLHAVQQGVVICSTGGYLVQCVDHLNDAVQNPLGQHQAQIAGGGTQGRRNKGILHPVGCGPAAPDQITKTLYDHTAAQHIAQAGDGLAVTVAVLEGASLVQSFQGFAWLARKAAFKVHPVTEQAPSQYFRSAFR